jgi:hypothetical protein
MPAKSVILDTYLEYSFDAPDVLAPLAQAGKLTRPQLHVLLPYVLRAIPCHIKIEQRTPRGVAYVTLPNRLLDFDRKGNIYDATEYSD